MTFQFLSLLLALGGAEGHKPYTGFDMIHHWMNHQIQHNQIKLIFKYEFNLIFEILQCPESAINCPLTVN